ncbi:MAG: TPR end-of-group domain-containing protein, partial [Deltaproteobacteria bacterium]
ARAAELDPAEGEIHAVLSEIYGELNRYADAAHECMQALQREIPKPLSATLKYNLACYQARLGHERESLWWLRQALEAGFDDVELLKRDPDLAAIRNTAAFKALFTP